MLWVLVVKLSARQEMFLSVVKKVAIEDSPVTPHDKDPTHKATMKATSNVFVNGKRVCRDGDKATCRHAVKSSQSRVQAG